MTPPTEAAEAAAPAIDPNQPCFLRVPAVCVPVVIRALENAGMGEAARAVRKFTTDYLDPAANAERVKWVRWAKDRTEVDGEIEFDADATISHSPDGGGNYVLGWAWVPNTEDDNGND